MIKTKTITIDLGQRSYSIYIGENLLNDSALLRKHIVGKQILLVSNQTVAALYLEKIKSLLAEYQCDVILLPDGEQYKNLLTLNQIFDVLLQKKHLRSTTLLALGGGVICDMTGFAAACYQRGVAFIQMPTTLLAQVDASIGGKTAVNHPLGKNMIGAFHQPQCVIVDVNTLISLPEREFIAGLAEIIKAAMICDAEFFSWLEQNSHKILAHDKAALVYAIEQACRIKAQIVAADEMETKSIRALLNLGHTFGHAIEQVCGYGEYLHGEAVAMGLVLAADLSVSVGKLPLADLQRIKQLLHAMRLPIQLPPDLQPDKILEAMTRDKKNVDQGMRLVLLPALGYAELTGVADVNKITQVLLSNSELK